MGLAIPTSENTLVGDSSKYALVERERRFLLREMPEPLTRASEHVQIWDNYLTGTRLRLRKVRVPQTKKWTMKLTQKFTPAPPDFSRTIITNTYLTAYEYEVLSIFEGNEIRKNRYPFEYEGRKYSIDVFLGALWGLILAETDFETDEEMDNFALPSFAAADVTNEELFTGGRLVDSTIDDLRPEMARLFERPQGEEPGLS
jgi:CYTH domain-containing protein